jgi:glyoxylase-like metal-dependent hydrolase (beta-lactamase superfamily II)
MIFRQVIHEDLGCASYLIGDEKAGVAAVVDPQLCVETYLEHARYAGVTIERIFETHNHADHVSGHGRLVAATGAGIHIHEEARPAYPHHPFVDGEQWDIGRLRVEALHTPGHRPEHTAFSLADARRSSEPWAVLTGDTVFVNDVARPDLAIDSVEGARLLFRSVRDEILALADHVELWPGHLGGSMCGGPTMDTKICSTVGFEKRHNRLLAIADEDTFVRAMLADLAPHMEPPRWPGHSST